MTVLRRRDHTKLLAVRIHRGHLRAVDRGEIDVEAGPLARLALDGDGAAALGHDTEDRRQPQPGPLADSLGREERLEDMRAHLIVHPDSAVLNRESQVVAGLEPLLGREEVQATDLGAVLRLRVVLGHDHPRRLDGELAAVGHRVPRVDAEVEDDLLDLTGVGEDRSKLLTELDLELDVLADQALEHLAHVGHDVVERELLRLEHLPPAEGEKLARKRGRAVAGLRDLREVPAYRMVGLELHQADLGEAEDAAEEVVEVVRDATGEQPDRLHLLGLLELLLAPTKRRFGLETIRHVADEPADEGALAILEEVRGHLHGDRAPSLDLVTRFERRRLALFERGPVRVPADSPLPRVELPDGQRQHLPATIPVELAGRFVDADDGPPTRRASPRRRPTCR